MQKDFLSIDFKVNERTQSVISRIKEKIPEFIETQKILLFVFKKLKMI